MKYILYVLLWATVTVSYADPSPVLVVVGMKSEADLVNQPGLIPVISAGNPELLRQRLQAFDRTALRAVVSLGVAGGLTPDMKPGQLVIAGSVTDGDWLWTTSRRLSSKAAKQLNALAPVKKRAAGWNTIAAVTPDDRAEMNAETGAAIVDNESQVAAEFADEHDLPLLVLRAVSDPSDFTLPPAALLPLLPTGVPDLNAIAASLNADPSQFNDLLKLNADTQTAIKTLSQAVLVLPSL